MVPLDEVLKATGPNAAIVFAAWIFMGFLQQRSDNAVARYREAIEDYRSHDHGESRGANLKDQVLILRHRCTLMGRATLSGVVAAILLISALLAAALDVIVPGTEAIPTIGVAANLTGFAMVIVAALFVIVEARVLRRQLDKEIGDMPELLDGRSGPAMARGPRRG